MVRFKYLKHILAFIFLFSIIVWGSVIIVKAEPEEIPRLSDTDFRIMKATLQKALIMRGKKAEWSNPEANHSGHFITYKNPEVQNRSCQAFKIVIVMDKKYSSTGVACENAPSKWSIENLLDLTGKNIVEPQKLQRQPFPMPPQGRQQFPFPPRGRQQMPPNNFPSPDFPFPPPRQ